MNQQAPTGPELQTLPQSERLKRVLWQAGLTPKTDQGLLAEHRREQRLMVESRGTCSVPGRFDRVPIMVNDISLTGIQFDLRQPVEVGDRCQVFFCLPGYAPCRMGVEVRWVRVARDEEGLYYQVGALRQLPPNTALEPLPES